MPILDEQRIFQIQRHGRAASDHHRADAASQRLFQIATRRQRHHEVQAGSGAQHQH